MIVNKDRKVTALKTNTYGKTRTYFEVDRIPDEGEEWMQSGYENATVDRVININDEVAEDNLLYEYTFYCVEIAYDDDIYKEYICIPVDEEID